jgi:uncharacterized protein
VFIEIEDLKDEPLRVHHIFPVGEIGFVHDDAALDKPVTADFMLSHNDRNLHVDGTVRTGIRFRCSRCTKEFTRPLDASFDLSYLPQPKWGKDSEVEIRYEDMEVAYYDGIRFDVDLMVLEQIELSIPMKFVCSEDCKGLCYKCGTDLNEGTCLCSRDDADSRLSVLLDFKNKMEK